MKYLKILSEISNPIRIKILLLLYDEKSTITELKNKIGDISHSEISRHMGRLAKLNFIAKESIPGRKYELTYFGRITVKLYRPLDFIFQNSEYFEDHQIDNIPEELLHGLHNLEAAELITGTGNLMVKVKNFIESAIKELWIMTNDPFPYEITIRHVYLIISPHVLKYGREVNHEITKYEVHTLTEVNVCILLSDMGHGFLFLPNLNSSNPDFNVGFYVSDPDGYNYLKELFYHFWQTSKEFKFDKTKFFRND